MARQIEYGQVIGFALGRLRVVLFGAGTPTGDYHYQAFGVPGLGLKQGLDQDQVVAPYATAIAAMLAPREALENFHRLAREGAEGPFGFYEAIDYTPRRVPKGRRSVVVKTYMAHHQGMSLTALANVLLDDVMPRRFHAEPKVRAVELLLQERPPHDPEIIETSATRSPVEEPIAAEIQERLHSDEPAPDHSGHAYTTDPFIVEHPISRHDHECRVRLTAPAGGIDVTRWREDPTCEAWGQFCYIRDSASRPRLVRRFPANLPAAESDEVSFAADKATFRRRDGDIETLLEVIVSPEQAVEVRRITLTNHGVRAARARADELCRNRAGRPRRRPGPPGVRQAFSRDGMDRWTRGPALPAPPAHCRRAVNLGRARFGRGRARHRAARRWAIFSTRPIDCVSLVADAPGEPGCPRPGFGPVGHDRSGSRPSILLAARSVRLEPGGSAVIALATGVAAVAL